MNNKKIKLINLAQIISTITIVIGAAWKIRHHPFGDSLLMISFASSILLSSIHIKLLKQII